MIEITLYWWYLPLALFLAPFIFVYLYDKVTGIDATDFGAAMIIIIVFVGCWVSAASIIIGKFL